MRTVKAKEKIVTCDFCGKKLYTNQDTGNPWAGAHWVIKETRFWGLYGNVMATLDVCKDCYKRIIGKDYTHE